MKALRYHGPRDVRYEEMDEPVIQDDRDVIVRMSHAGICGSDLHIYHGQGFSQELGYCVGHEAVGRVVEVGAGVRRLKIGDDVMLSAAVGCGACAPCLAGNIGRCETAGAGCYGLGPALQGCQAELIRVPKGDFNAAPIPDGLTAEQALMLTDNLPTAYFGCINADIGPGKSVAVVGLGPIGLMAVEIASVLGASRVFAIDLVPERRALARALGAEATRRGDRGAGDLRGDERPDGRLRRRGGRRGRDGADGDPARGPGGTTSVVGVNQNMKFAFPMALAFVKSLTFRIGMCSVQCHWPQLVPLIRAGRLHPERFISHRMPLSEGARAYELFDARADGALKMVLTA